MKKITTSISLVLLIGIYLTAGVSATVYRSDVDQDYGFYRITSMDKNQTVSYDKNNDTLTINVSDSVVWINDATPDEPLTIISEQGLWNSTSARLRWNYQKFNYTFNESGTYSFYIKEYPNEKHQIIIVNPIDTPMPKTTIVVRQTPTVNQTTNEASTVNQTTNETLIKSPTKPSDNSIFIFEIIVIIVAILLTLYIKRKS